MAPRAETTRPPIRGGDLGLGHGAADQVGRAIRPQLLKHLFLPDVIVADRIGHHLVERQVARAVARHQHGADGAQAEPLPHHLRRHPEPGADLLGAEAAPLGLFAEGLELVGGMHARAGDVFVQADLVRVVGEVHDAPHGFRLLDHLALGQQQQGQAAALTDGRQIEAGCPGLVRLRLHHRGLKDALHRDAGGQGLDVRLRMGRAPRIAR